MILNLLRFAGLYSEIEKTPKGPKLFVHATAPERGTFFWLFNPESAPRFDSSGGLWIQKCPEGDTLEVFDAKHKSSFYPRVKELDHLIKLLDVLHERGNLETPTFTDWSLIAKAQLGFAQTVERRAQGASALIEKSKNRLQAFQAKLDTRPNQWPPREKP